MENSKTSKKSSLLPLMLAVLIDMIGIGIIIPVVAPLIINNETGIVPDSWSPFMRDIILGLLLTCYPLAQFFGAPVLGAMSDKFGRKPILTLALLGSMLGYILFGMGVVSNGLLLVFLGRLLDGFTGGNISIVYSAIADISTNESRTRNFGLVGMMFGIGIIIGPAIGGLLANPEYVSWFGPEVPFWVAAGLCGLNALFVVFMFSETIQEKSSAPIDPFTGFRNIRIAFTLPRLGTLFTVVFLLTLGFAFFTTFFSVFMIKKFQFDETDIGWIFVYIGFWIALVQGGVVAPIAKRFAPGQTIQWAALGLGIALPLLLFPSQAWAIYLVTPLVAFTQGLTGPNINTLVSESALPEQQGLIMGINQSIAALGNAVPPLLAGFLSSVNYNFPILTAGIITLVAAGVFYLFYYRKQF